MFGNLGGNFELRVCAVNRAGRGACAEKSIILPGGYLHFCILHVCLGSLSFETENLVEVTDLHFEKIYATHWEEHIYVSDHSDAPKVSKI